MVPVTESDGFVARDAESNRIEKITAEARPLSPQPLPGTILPAPCDVPAQQIRTISPPLSVSSRIFCRFCTRIFANSPVCVGCMCVHTPLVRASRPCSLFYSKLRGQGARRRTSGWIRINTHGRRSQGCAFRVAGTDADGAV